MLPFNKHVTVWVQKFKDRENLMLQWSDPDTGKRKTKSADTSNRMMAEARARELEYEINHGLHQQASNMPWAKFRELFEREHVSGCRPGTRENYRDTFAVFERLCNVTSLRNITARTISAFVGALRHAGGRYGAPMQESTIKVRLQFLKTALSWAVKQKFLPECPEFPSVRPPKRRPQPVPVESFERLLHKAPDDMWRTFLLTGWRAGLRLNEACALEWQETDKAPFLDLARDRIVFPAGFVKAAEDQWLPLDDELREALLALPRCGRKVFRFVERREDKRKGRVLKPTSVGRSVTRLARLAGVKLTMKSLRRGFGCYWASRVPAQVLQKLMRHSNIRITMEYYANVDDAVVRAMMGREPSQRNSPRNDGAIEAFNPSPEGSITPDGEKNSGRPVF